MLNKRTENLTPRSQKCLLDNSNMGMFAPWATPQFSLKCRAVVSLGQDMAEWESRGEILFNVRQKSRYVITSCYTVFNQK